jgi:hypothetical protein
LASDISLIFIPNQVYSLIQSAQGKENQREKINPDAIMPNEKRIKGKNKSK